MASSASTYQVAISGASGFLGRALATSLEADGVRVSKLVRRPAAGEDEIFWDPQNDAIDGGALEGVDAVVHLAGESIAGLWSPSKKRRIFESRSSGTRLLARTIAQLDAPPRTFVSASAVGYYGDAGEVELSEEHPPGDDFLSGVCIAWEEEAKGALQAGVRVINPRFGLILDEEGGAFPLMTMPFRFGLGARLGNGQQWMSWISLTDAVRVIRYCLDTEDIEGPVNAVAPTPIRNADFTNVLGRALARPTFLVAPAFLLKAATGGMADALLLASQRARPAVLAARGFTFSDPTFEDFLKKRRAGRRLAGGSG